MSERGQPSAKQPTEATPADDALRSELAGYTDDDAARVNLDGKSVKEFRTLCWCMGLNTSRHDKGDLVNLIISNRGAHAGAPYDPCPSLYVMVTAAGEHLSNAVRQGDAATVATLLSTYDSQSFINYDDSYGITSLARSGHESVTSNLIET